MEIGTLTATPFVQFPQQFDGCQFAQANSGELKMIDFSFPTRRIALIRGWELFPLQSR